MDETVLDSYLNCIPFSMAAYETAILVFANKEKEDKINWPFRIDIYITEPGNAQGWKEPLEII